MITNAQRSKMKKILGSKWIPDVIEKLNQENVLNKKGEEYTKAFISHVFNGKNEHHIIEDVIFDIYQEKKLKLSKMKVARKLKLNQ